MGRGRREPAPAGRRRQVLQIGSLSRHQPRENNHRDFGGESSATVVQATQKPVASAAQGRGFSLLGAYDGSGSEDDDDTNGNGQIDNQVKDFLKELQVDEPEPKPTGDATSAEAPGSVQPAAESTPVWHECLDPNSGHVYYWNTITNEVSWTLPEDFNSAMTSSAATSTTPAATATSSAYSAPSGYGEEESGSAHGAGNDEEAMEDDDSDCNIENYDDDDTEVPAKSTEPSQMQLAYPTVSTGLVPDDEPAVDSPTLAAGCDEDINFEHHSSNEEEDSAAAGRSSITSASTSPTSQKRSEAASPEADAGDAHTLSCASVDSAPSSCTSSRPQSPARQFLKPLQATAADTDRRSPTAPLDSPAVSPSDVCMDAKHVIAADTGLDEKETVAESPVESAVESAAPTGLDDIMFANVPAASFKPVTTGSGRNSPSASENRPDKLQAKMQSTTLALKPRSLSRTDTKKTPPVKEELSRDEKTVASVDCNKPAGDVSAVDIFAEDTGSTEDQANSAPSLSLPPSPAQATPKAGSSVGQDDLGDFDIDAALDECLENALNKPDKRPHDDGVADEEETDIGEAESNSLQPTSKRAKLPSADVPENTISPMHLSPARPEDMEVAAESDVDMDLSAPERSTSTLAPTADTGNQSSDAIGDQLLVLSNELSTKLNSLNITTAEMSNLHLALVRAETRLADWQAGALDGSYAVRMLQSSVTELHNYEQACAPQGWQCLWDRWVPV
eukprot:scpid52762/ scgid14366/ Formin-binding protein 4; Formin-binding protein 30